MFATAQFTETGGDIAAWDHGVGDFSFCAAGAGTLVYEGTTGHEVGSRTGVIPSGHDVFESSLIGNVGGT